MRMAVIVSIMSLMFVRVMGMPLLPMPSAAASSLLFTDEDNLKGDPLEGQLVAGTTEKFHGAARRFVRCPQLDPDRLLREMGKGLFHLPVENEGDIGIELFLKLIELHISMLPGTGFKHRQHEDILAGVMGKGIEHARALNTRVGRRGVGVCQIFAEGNHM